MRSLGHRRWLYNNSFPPSPVFSCPCWASKVHPCPPFNIIFPPLLLSTFSSFPCTVPCRIVFAKPEDLVTCPNHLSFRFLPKVRSSSYFPKAAWMFCEYPHWWNGPCLRCSVTFGSISSQRPASFSLALLSRSMTRRRTEIWIWQENASVLHQDDGRAIMKGFGSPFAIENIYASGNRNRDCWISKTALNPPSYRGFFQQTRQP